MTTVFAPFTIHDVMTLLPGLRERALKEELRKHGCATEVRGKLFVSLEQFRRFMKVNELCPCTSTGEKTSPISTELLGLNAYEEALALATRKSQSVSEPKRKRVLSRPNSMEQRTKRPSLTLLEPTSRPGSPADILRHSFGRSAKDDSPPSNRGN